MKRNLFIPLSFFLTTLFIFLSMASLFLQFRTIYCVICFEGFWIFHSPFCCYSIFMISISSLLFYFYVSTKNDQVGKNDVVKRTCLLLGVRRVTIVSLIFPLSKFSQEQIGRFLKLHLFLETEMLFSTITLNSSFSKYFNYCWYQVGQRTQR